MIVYRIPPLPPSPLTLLVVLGLPVPRQPDLPRPAQPGLAHLHQKEDDLARYVSRDAVDVHVAPPRHHVDQLDVVEGAVLNRLVDLSL